LKGLEFNFWGDFKDLTEDTVKKMRAILDKNGVEASMLGLWGWNHLSPDDGVRAEALAMMDRAIGFAKLIGADVFVTGAGDMPEEKLGPIWGKQPFQDKMVLLSKRYIEQFLP
jgi:sugar phosphate isomerase/epimerase